MKFRILSLSLIAAMSLIISTNVFACGGEASGKHIGSVLKVNAGNSTFTIRDAETNSPITFNADKSIMGEIKNASGRIMVNYEENDDGALNAVAVSF